MKATYSQRLIKLADLNHHQTFFAGRCSEYFLESSYFAVAQYVEPKDENHHSRPHGITLEPETEEERFLQQQALEVMEDSKRRAKAMNQRH